MTRCVRILLVLPRLGIVITHVCFKKLAVRDFIKDIQVPYTFVDVGWWMQLSLPMPERSSGLMKERMNILYGEGNNRTLVTDLNHIGTYMARIIADHRTVNHAVIIWEEEVTQLEALEVGYRYSGEGDFLRAKRVSVGVPFPDGTSELTTKPFIGFCRCSRTGY